MAAASWGMMMPATIPHRTSAMENIASSEAMTMSQAAAIPVPPPKHPPWISATVGFGQASRNRTASMVRCEASMLAASSPVRTSLSQLRSAPAWKCRPLPRITTTRTEASSWSAPTPSIMASIMSRL